MNAKLASAIAGIIAMTTATLFTTVFKLTATKDLIAAALFTLVAIVSIIWQWDKTKNYLSAGEEILFYTSLASVVVPWMIVWTSNLDGASKYALVTSAGCVYASGILHLKREEIFPFTMFVIPATMASILSLGGVLDNWSEAQNVAASLALGTYAIIAAITAGARARGNLATLGAILSFMAMAGCLAWTLLTNNEELSSLSLLLGGLSAVLASFPTKERNKRLLGPTFSAT